MRIAQPAALKLAQPAAVRQEQPAAFTLVLPAAVRQEQPTSVKAQQGADTLVSAQCACGGDVMDSYSRIAAGSGVQRLSWHIHLYTLQQL